MCFQVLSRFLRCVCLFMLLIQRDKFFITFNGNTKDIEKLGETGNP